MISAFVGILICYLGVIRIQSKWFRRGVLTEVSFVLLQVSVLSLLILTGFLAFSTTLEGVVIGSLLTLIFVTFGMPLARRIYKERFTPK